MADAEIRINLVNGSKGAANKIAKGFKKVGDAAGSAGKQINFFNTRTADFIKGLVGFNVIESVFRRVGVEINDLIVKMVGVNSSTELYLITLQTLTGSQEAAQAAFDELQQFARETPFQLDTLVKTFIKMKAQGLDPSIESMRTLGDTASALGGGAEVFDGIARALGQIKTKGRVQTEELLQLAERGVPIFDILREKLELTGEEIQNIGRQGVSADKVLGAIFEGLDERFAGQMANVRDTFSGTTEELKSLFEEFLLFIGAEGSFDLIKKELRSVRDFIIEAFESGAAKQFASDINTVFEVLVGISKLVLFITANIAAFGVVLAKLPGFFHEIGQSVVESFSSLEPGENIFLRLLGLTPETLDETIVFWKDAFNKLIVILKTFISDIQAVIDNAASKMFNSGKALMNSFKDGILSAANSVIESVKSIVQRIRNFLPSSPAKEGPLSDLNKVGPGLIDTISSGVDNSSSDLIRSIQSMTGAARIEMANNFASPPAGSTPGGSVNNSTSNSSTNIAPVFNITVNAGSGGNQDIATQVDAELARLWATDRSRLKKVMQK